MSNDTTVSGLILVLAAIGIMLLIVFVPGSAGAVECRSSPGDLKKSHYMWRTIEDRKCWYAGRRQLPKSSLHWPKYMDPQLPAKKTAPAYRAEVVNPKDLNEIDRKMPGDPRYSGPLIMFPELQDKLDTLKRWWDRRWEPSP